MKVIIQLQYSLADSRVFHDVKNITQASLHPTQPNPTHQKFKNSDPTQPNPTQPNPWVDPTHDQLWYKLLFRSIDCLFSFYFAATNIFNKYVSKIHVRQARGAVKIMCNPAPPFRRQHSRRLLYLYASIYSTQGNENDVSNTSASRIGGFYQRQR